MRANDACERAANRLTPTVGQASCICGLSRLDLGRRLMYLLRKLGSRRVWERIFVERLTEPIHLNVISAVVGVVGTSRAKIAWDLLPRHQHAFGLLDAADRAKAYGVKRITAIEFGVANGAGLLNICELAARITKATGIDIDVVGFDSGSGMPEIRSYKDHPEAYQPGWYPMQDRPRLEAALPPNAKLIIGSLADTVPAFTSGLSAEAPIGFVSIDVDYHWSALEALEVFTSAPVGYLPVVVIYLDDVNRDIHNPWSGELAAVHEFNDRNELRKIGPLNFLRESRIFKNAKWISQMYALHVFDHPLRFSVLSEYGEVVLGNPYLPAPSEDRDVDGGQAGAPPRHR